MPIAFIPSDLAPGDARAAEFDSGGLQWDRIRSVDDPLFDFAYSQLWAEFGATHEMERRETLARRFALVPRMIYEMILVRREGHFLAVRDHTAIVSRDGSHAVVHLSHNLVAPEARRTGLAGWMRALPIQTARELLANRSAAITLAAEMEYDDASDPKRAIRLRAYERAGFVKLDPQFVQYHQPDFRDPADIDAGGGARPVPFQLIVRRVGRESEAAVSGAEIRVLVQSLHDIYGPQFRAKDMAHPLLDVARLPAPDVTVPLIPPTQC